MLCWPQIYFHVFPSGASADLRCFELIEKMPSSLRVAPSVSNICRWPAGNTQHNSSTDAAGTARYPLILITAEPGRACFTTYHIGPSTSALPACGA